MLVLRAVERGSISLDETLDQFELGFSADYQSTVTVAHLLDHRSGFNDIFVAAYREDPLAFESLQSKLDLMRDTPLRFDPGTDRLYSNYNYIVLGAILEKRSGRTFETLLDKEILEPLRLNDSALQADPALTHQSTRYTYRYHNVLSPVGITEHPSPDGGLESTVVDVWRFYRSLFHSDVLINDKTLLNKHNFQYPEGRWRAYGGGLGISAAADIDLERDIEIIVLTNSDKLVAEEISNRLHAFWSEGAHAPVRQHPVNFAYGIFERSGAADYCDALSVAYAEQDYRPFIGRTLNTLGIQLLDNHREEAAMAQFQCLAQRFPGAPQAWDSLAMGYERMGDTDQARATFEKALAIDAGFQSDYSANNYVE